MARRRLTLARFVAATLVTVTAGGWSAVTSSVTEFEKADPNGLRTSTRNLAPSSARAVDGRVKVGPVAPGTSTLFFCHW